jgi:hypothetical protein
MLREALHEDVNECSMSFVTKSVESLALPEDIDAHRGAEGRSNGFDTPERNVREESSLDSADL